jgi:tetratricopeptide (TPR) repeat protein
MKKVIFICLTSALLIDCAPRVTLHTSSNLTPKPQNCKLDIYYPYQIINLKYTVVGDIYVGDTGFTVNCDKDTLINNIIKPKGCELGVDAIQINKISNPDLISTCYRLRANFLKYTDVSSTPALTDLCKDAEYYMKEGKRFIATQPANASKLYAEALRICTSEPAIYYNLSLAYYLEGKSEEAIEILNEGLIADPDHLNLNKALAYIYIASGIDPNKGREIIRKVLENYPDDEQAKRIDILFILDQKNTMILDYLQPIKSEIKVIGRFQVIKDQVVFDKENNLYWSRLKPARGYYNSASRYCSSLSLGGFNDWRLPIKNEISTLVVIGKQPKRKRPLFDEKVFPHHRAKRYWVYNHNKNDENIFTNKITYDMEKGKDSKVASRGFVWCVRADTGTSAGQ